MATKHTTTAPALTPHQRRDLAKATRLHESTTEAAKRAFDRAVEPAKRRYDAAVQAADEALDAAVAAITAGTASQA